MLTAVSQRERTANVATLTTATDHGLLPGDPLWVADVGADFDGSFFIEDVPTTATLTYVNLGPDVAQEAATGTVDKWSPWTAEPPTLEDLRRYVGANSTKDDELLQEVLDTAILWVNGRIYVSSQGTPEANLAILMLASRLYKRRQSPEGAAGFGGEGVVVRIMANDPDIRALLERHLNMTDETTGIGVG